MNWAVIQQGHEQQDRFMELLLEAQADDMELRRQELAFLQAEVVETRLLQRECVSASLQSISAMACKSDFVLKVQHFGHFESALQQALASLPGWI